MMWIDNGVIEQTAEFSITVSRISCYTNHIRVVTVIFDRAVVMIHVILTIRVLRNTVRSSVRCSGRASFVEQFADKSAADL